VLVADFHSAELRCRGIEAVNLLEDPGFEVIGRELAPNKVALDQNVALNRDQEKHLGIHQWFPEKSPYHCVLTAGHAHGGRWSLMLEQCYRTRFSRPVPAAPGDRFRVGLWLKHNDGKARYSVAVDARLEDGSYPTLTTIPVATKPGEWQQLVTEITVPAKVRMILLRVFVNAQDVDARCWLDDLFMGKYPR
jgi:hypothetical protein